MTKPDAVKTPTINTETLLVVDDEVLVRLAICAYLRECAFRVIEAANADEALIVLQEPDLKIDIVLSDVEMPGTMDGFGLSHWMRAHKPAIPIILVGSPPAAVDAAADLCESGPMLAKPYDQQILLDQIRRTLVDGQATSKDSAPGQRRDTPFGSGIQA